jgi:hypothetical protein
MTRCVVCNSLMGGGYSDVEGRFCSLPCFTASERPDFCERCISETTDEEPGSTFTFNMIGTGMFGAADRCRDCHSVIRRKCIQILFPVFTLGRYRVRYVDGTRFMGRKLRG